MDELIRRIEDAFADVVYPGDDDLTDSGYGEEPAALVEDFRGETDWRALSGAFLDQAPGAGARRCRSSPPRPCSSTCPPT